MFRFNKHTGKKQERYICRFGTEILGLGFEAGLSVGELDSLKRRSHALVNGLSDFKNRFSRLRRKIAREHRKDVHLAT